MPNIEGDTPSLEEAAYWWASYGFHVVPFKPDKSGAFVPYKNSISPTPEEAEKLFATYRPALIAIKLPKNVVVLDLDPRKDLTLEHIEDMLHTKFELPETYSVHTPSGGIHLWYRLPEGVTLKNGVKSLQDVPGVDVRTNGGLIIVPNSVRPDGTYLTQHYVEELPLAPQNLIDALTSDKTPAKDDPPNTTPLEGLTMEADSAIAQYGEKALHEELEKVTKAQKGERNDTLYKAALKLGSLCAAGALPDTCPKLLFRAAEANGLVNDDKEITVRRTIENGWSNGLMNPRDLSEMKNQPVLAVNDNKASSNTEVQPTPIPLVRDPVPAAPYPVDALCSLRPVVEAVARITKAPIEIAAQSALAVNSLCVQGHADVQTLVGTYEPISIFALTIAESGERKSTVDKLMMRGVREHEQSQRQRYMSEEVDFERRQKTWEKKANKALDKLYDVKDDPDLIQDDLDKAKHEYNELLQEEPKPPLHYLRTLADPTIEGLFKFCQQGHPSLALFSDEGGQFVGGHSMSTEKKLHTMAALCDFWGGKIRDRVRALDDIAVLEGRRLSLHLMAQPVAFQNLLNDEVAQQQGFLGRCLISQPPSNIGNRPFCPAQESDLDIVDAFALETQELLQIACPYVSEKDPQVLSPRQLPLCKEAKEELAEFHDCAEREMADFGRYSAIRPLACKAAEYAARLAGAFSLRANINVDQVDAGTMCDAIRLVKYYLEESIRLQDEAATNKRYADAQKLLDWTNNKWHKRAYNVDADFNFITLRDIRNFGPNKFRDEEDYILSLVQILVDHGHLMKDKPTTSKQNSTALRYRIIKE